MTHCEIADYVVIDKAARTTRAQPPSAPEFVHSDVRDCSAQTTQEALRRALDAHPITSIYTVTFFILSVILLISLAAIVLFGVLLIALLVAVSGVLLILALGTRLAMILILTMALLTCGAATIAAFSVVGPPIFRTACRGLSQTHGLPSHTDWAIFSDAFMTYLRNARERHATLASTTPGVHASTSQAEGLPSKTVQWICAFPWEEWYTLIMTAFRNVISRLHPDLSVPKLVALTSKIAFDLTEKSIRLSELVMAFLWSFFPQNRSAQRMPESANAPRGTDSSGVSTSVYLNIQQAEESQPPTSVSRRGAGSHIDGS